MTLTTSIANITGDVFKEDNESLPWERIVTRKRDERTRKLQLASRLSLDKPIPCLPPSSRKNVRDWPLQSGDLTPRQITITNSIPSYILQKIAAREWSAEEVLLAFVARAVMAQYLTNALSDIFVEEGLRRAKELDTHLERTGKPIGPLHGLPISLKDVIHIKGHSTTLGFVALADQVMEDSDDIVHHLSDAGAVFYCKTNVPQGLMSGECVNFLYGRTCTPDNIQLSAGGSSGGEGALIALGGSPIGIGTDIGGSIRTPANFNGVYGLCPSQGRLPLHSAKFTSPTYLISGVAGPISRCIDGLEVYTRTLLSLEPWKWDFSCIDLPWRQSIYDGIRADAAARKLSFGFVAHDGIVRPHVPIERGMAEVKSALKQLGFDVVDIELFDGSEGLEEIMVRCFGCTGGRSTRELISRLPEPVIKELVLPSPEDSLSAQEMLELGKAVYNVRQNMLQRWQDTKHLTKNGCPVDVFIMPSGGHVAPPHGTMEYLLYEAISNILDWTCATIPVGRVDALLDPKPSAESGFRPMSEPDGRNWDKCTLILPT